MRIAVTLVLLAVALLVNGCIPSPSTDKACMNKCKAFKTKPYGVILDRHGGVRGNLYTIEIEGKHYFITEGMNVSIGPEVHVESSTNESSR